MDLKHEIATINNHLSSEGIALRIEQRGETLNLRGPLPSQGTKEIIKTQRISLGINADKKGLSEAQRILELIRWQLDHNQFDWKDWVKKKSKSDESNEQSLPNQAIEAFKKTFFSDPIRRRSPSSSLTTWRSSYLPYLRRLLSFTSGTGKNIDEEILCKTLASYCESSRSRKQCATTLSALAKHLDIPLPEDWKIRASGYGLGQANFRLLPSDQIIIDAWSQITNPGWKLAYGLMATYGLRNHEIFFCDLSGMTKEGDKVLRILPNTKTGEHQVWPFHPHWVELFGLDKLANNPKALPQIKTDLTQTTLQNVGKRVSEQFRRYKLPLTPYNLRHAWAIRTIHIGLPDTVAARMMGHSVGIHTSTYHHWITRRDQQQAVDAALAKKHTKE